MGTCAFCGYENVSGTLFCEGCGSGLTAEAQGHRYSTGTVLAGRGETNAATRPAGSRFTTGDVSEAAAPAASEREQQFGAPRPASTDEPVADDWTAAAGSEHAAIIGTDSIWSAAPETAPAPVPPSGSGQLGAAPAAPSPGIPVPAAPQPAAPLAAAPQPAAPQPVPAAAPQPAPATTAVHLVSETGRRVDVPVQDVVIVGREDMRSGIRPDVDLTLDGASAAGVSRRHCRLLHQTDGWYVEDLMSTNFTVLNGKPLAPHTPVRVQHGDELRLGKLRLRFQQS